MGVAEAGMRVAGVEACLPFFTDAAPEPGDIRLPTLPDDRIRLACCFVRDARLLDPAPTIEDQGFELVRRSSPHAMSDDPIVLRDLYQPETAEYVRRRLGASRVISSYAGTIRRSIIADTSAARDSQPVRHLQVAVFAHGDFVPGEAERDAARECRNWGIEVPPHSRLMIVQAWRVQTPPPQDFPLTMCDRRSLKQTAVSVRSGLMNSGTSPDRPENRYNMLGISHDPAQIWYYYPDMVPDELLLFTGYDSADPDGARVGHVAFDNRANVDATVPRRSIESRFYVFFD